MFFKNYKCHHVEKLTGTNNAITRLIFILKYVVKFPIYYTPLTFCQPE